MNFSSHLCTGDADVDTDAWDVDSDIESTRPSIADVLRTIGSTQYHVRSKYHASHLRHSESLGPSLVPKRSRTATRDKNDACTDFGDVCDANSAVNFTAEGDITAATKVGNSEKTVEHSANGV